MESMSVASTLSADERCAQQQDESIFKAMSALSMERRALLLLRCSETMPVTWSGAEELSGRRLTMPRRYGFCQQCAAYLYPGDLHAPWCRMETSSSEEKSLTPDLEPGPISQWYDPYLAQARGPWERSSMPVSAIRASGTLDPTRGARAVGLYSGVGPERNLIFY